MIMADLLMPFIDLYDLYESFYTPKTTRKALEICRYLPKMVQNYGWTQLRGYEALPTKKYSV